MNQNRDLPIQVRRYNSQGEVIHTYVFAGKEDLTEEEAQQLNIEGSATIYTLLIHLDDTIETIKKKILLAIHDDQEENQDNPDDLLIDYHDLYLTTSVNQYISPVTLSTLLFDEDETVSRETLLRILSNFQPSEALDIEEKEYYTRGEIQTLPLTREQHIVRPLGIHYRNPNLSLLTVANPAYAIKHKLIHGQTASPFKHGYDKELLLDYTYYSKAPLVLNLYLAKDFPSLGSTFFPKATQKTTADDNQDYTEMGLFAHYRRFQKYYQVPESMPFEHGIKTIDFIMKSPLPTKRPYPLEMVFQNIHASVITPFVCYIPGGNREGMVRLYYEQSAANGQHIPLISPNIISKLRTEFRQQQRIGMYFPFEGTKAFYVEITVTGEVHIRSNHWSEGIVPFSIHAFLLETITPVLRNINAMVRHHPLPFYIDINAPDIQMRSLTYQVSTNLKKHQSLFKTLQSCNKPLFIPLHTQGRTMDLLYNRVSQLHRIPELGDLVKSKNVEGIRNRIREKRKEGRNPGFTCKISIASENRLTWEIQDMTSYRYIECWFQYINAWLSWIENDTPLKIDEVCFVPPGLKSKTKSQSKSKSSSENSQEEEDYTLMKPPVDETHAIATEDDEVEDDGNVEKYLNVEDSSASSPDYFDSLVSGPSSSSTQRGGGGSSSSEDSDEEDSEGSDETDSYEDDEEDVEDADLDSADIINNSEALVNTPNKNIPLDRMNKHDPELIKIQDTDGKKVAYSRACPMSRQPLLVTDEELAKIKKDSPNSINQVLRMGKKQPYNYICPRFWCLKTNTSMTEEEVKSGKCGKIIPQDAKTVPKGHYVVEFTGKERLNDQNEYIEQYPGIHANYCAPCCFSINNQKIAKSQPQRRKQCMVKDVEESENSEDDSDSSSQPQLSRKVDNPRKKDNIMSMETFPLPVQRYGRLPLTVQHFFQVDYTKDISEKNLLVAQSPNHPGTPIRYGVEQQVNLLDVRVHTM